MQDFVLHLLELGRDVAFSVFDSLLADVLRRHAVHLAARHLDEVAEDRVEADLQTGHAALLDLIGLEARHPTLGVPSDGAQLVQLGMHAGSHQAAVFERQRWRIDQGGADARDELLKRVQAVGNVRQVQRIAAGQLLFQAARRSERVGERHQVAAIGTQGRDLGYQALNVEHIAQQLAHVLAQERAAVQFGHSPLARQNRLHFAQRIRQPLMQQPPAHRRQRGI